MKELSVTSLDTVSPYCYKKRNCSGFLVKYGEKKYLLDAGNGITCYTDMKNDLINLKVLISHLHVDHYGDVPYLAQSALVYKRFGVLTDDLNIYIPNGDVLSSGLSEKKHIEDYYYIHSLAEEYPVNIIDYGSLYIMMMMLKLLSLLSHIK